MKILLDENLPRKLVLALRAEGHQVNKDFITAFRAADLTRFQHGGDWP